MLIMNLLFIYLIEKIEDSIFTGTYTLYSNRNYVMKIRDLIKGLTYFYYRSYLHADLMINTCFFSFYYLVNSPYYIQNTKSISI